MNTQSNRFISQRNLVLTSLGIVTGFLLLVALLGWFMLDQLDAQGRRAKVDALRTVLQTTQNAMRIWIEDRKNHVVKWATDPAMVKLVKELVESPGHREKLLRSPALAAMREFLGDDIRLSGFEGFFVITPDNISIGSMRDANVGTKNLIAIQRMDLLKRAFQGETVFVPPIWSDVPLGHGRTKEIRPSPPTMFIAVPVKDENGKVLAVLTGRMAPELDFSRLAHGGRIGSSGETYFIDSRGRLLTESRFYVQLQRSGLVKPGETSVLNIEIRDPGGNLLEGFRPETPRASQPLTLMAESAVNGISGQSTEPYNDYRGVPVLGAWLWDDEIEIGMTTEIDFAEAAASTFQSRIFFGWIMGVTVFFALGMSFSLIFLSKQGEKKMRASEEKFRILFDSSHDAILLLSPTRGYIDCNDAALRLFGIPSKKEILGFTPLELSPEFQPDGSLSLEKDTQLTEMALKEGNNFFEWTHRRLNGEEFPATVLVTSFVLNGEQTFQGTVRDISEQKKTEEEILNTNMLLNSLIDSIPDLIFYKDQEGVYLGCNNSFVEFAGYSKEYIEGRTDLDLFDQEIAELFRKKDRQMLAKGESRRNEEWVSYPDGRKALFDTITTPYLGPNGQILGLIGINRDITDQNEARTALQKSRDLLNTAQEIGHIGSWEWHISTGELDWTDEVYRIFGREPQGFKANYESFMETIHPEDREQVQNAVGAALAGSSPYDIEHRIVLPDGTERIVKETGKIERGEGGSPLRMIGSVQDITEMKAIENDLRNYHNHLEELVKERTLELQKAKEDAETANRAKSSFLANMSHEIRTPMNTIIGMTDLVLETSLQPEQRKFLQSVAGSAKSLLTLLNDILDLSKLETGKMDFESIAFSPRRLFDGVVDMVQLQAAAKGVSLKAEIDGQIPRYLLGDPVRLRQVLVNLAGNAVKFTERGEVTLGMVPGKEEGACLFHVQDTGIGIPRDRLEGIFDRFSQADESTTRRFGGTGLGTSISREIVEQMGGRIWVDSEEYRGSNFQFTVHLPDAGDEVDCGNEFTAQSVDNAPRTRSLRILLAEDVPLNQELATIRLQQRGHVVTVAENGRIALDMFKEQSFDLVLMDVMMPEMDGLAATRKIREHEGKNGEHIPIIMLTASVMRADQAIYLKDGAADDFVGKPINFFELYGKIARFFPVITPEQQQAAQTGQVTAPFPVLDGIDVNKGLSNWGDAVTYRKSLLAFLKDYGDTMERIIAVVEQGEQEKAVHLIHKLRGVAANLGALRLAATLARLENAAGAGLEKAAGLLPMARDEMRIVTSSLNNLGEPSVPAGESSGVVRGDPDATLELLKRLGAGLAINSLDEAVLDQLAEALTPSAFNRLERPIDDFSFKQAREMVADLLREIGKERS